MLDFCCSDSYTKAQEKAALAEDTSNLETEASDVEKAKSRQRRHSTSSPDARLPDPPGMQYCILSEYSTYWLRVIQYLLL